MMAQPMTCQPMTRRAAAVIALALCWSAAQAADQAIPDPAILGLPPVAHPADNPPNAAKIALGKKLFFDKRLSADGRMACATCHDPDQGFTTNGAPTHRGSGDRPLKRNAPTALNAAFEPSLLWNGGMPSLEALAWGPMLNPDEMANPSADAVLKRVAALADYAGTFAAAFAGAGPSKGDFARAIAAYERTLVSGNSRFDRWWFAGDKSALNAEEQRGLLLFMFRAGCAQCHKVEEGFALFSDAKFHDIGAGKAGGPPDPGRAEVTGAEEDRGKFRTPGLRNVALTAPYMHDGSLGTLEEVVEFYDKGGGDGPNKAEWLYPLGLSAADKRALAAFLRTLTGDPPRQ